MRQSKFLIIVITFVLLLAVVAGCGGPSASPEPPPSPEQTEASDGQVTIVLDKVERVDSIPPDIVEELSSAGYPQYEARVATEGCDFICIRLTIAYIEDVHVIDALGYRNEESTLHGAEGHRYEVVCGVISPVMLRDPKHPVTGAEYMEGAKGILVFEVPRDEGPAKFTFIYSFKETWEEESAKRGQIDVICE